MHHAPALSLSLPPDRGWRRGVQGLGTLVVFTTLVWLGWHVTQFGAPTAPMLAVSALSAALVVWLWRKHLTMHHTRHCVQHLAWHPQDGRWSLQTEAAPPRLGQLDCLADTGRWMLLRHGGPGLSPVWLPLSHHDHPAHWHTLRCAVFTPGASVPPPPTPMPADE